MTEKNENLKKLEGGRAWKPAPTKANIHNEPGRIRLTLGLPVR
jgi:hypothetical protein